MTSLFAPSFTSRDSELMNFLAVPEHKAFLEGLWQNFKPHLKPREEKEFRDFEAQPHPRIWEMYLANAMADRGKTVSEKLREGPDIKLCDPTVWIEAVVSTDGHKGIDNGRYGAALHKTRSLRDFRLASRKRKAS